MNRGSSSYRNSTSQQTSGRRCAVNGNGRQPFHVQNEGVLAVRVARGSRAISPGVVARLDRVPSERGQCAGRRCAVPPEHGGSTGTTAQGSQWRARSNQTRSGATERAKRIGYGRAARDPSERRAARTVFAARSAER